MVAGKRPKFVLLILTTIVGAISARVWLGSPPSAVAAGPEQITNSLDRDTSGARARNRLAALNAHINPRSTRPIAGRSYPIPKLEQTTLTRRSNGHPVLSRLPSFSTQFEGKIVSQSNNRDFIFYTFDPELQTFAESLVRKADAPHVAVVAMSPSTGKILAIAQKSKTIENPALHAGFPAASLFKLVTAAAAIEARDITGDDKVPFRGGIYTLNRANYLPDGRRDRRTMTVEEALGKSCNPVFGRIGLKLSAPVLREYARNFGFNAALGFDAPLPTSGASIPSDAFELSRTAAGFGDVSISPIHAATLMSGIANGGLLPRPMIIDHIVSPDGAVLYQSKPHMLMRVVNNSTANELLDMMESTTTIGTSQKEFFFKKRPLLRNIKVAAKTGTLSGKDPIGVNHWFIAAAPLDRPKITLAVISVNPGRSTTKSSRIGRQMIEKYLTR